MPRFGKPITAGGPLFTTGHAAFPNIDHFVLGEAEELMPQVIEDMRRGAVHPTYAASNRPDITRVPSPRWDLIDLRNYITMSVQFSRGCPFDCEFCDIIVMNGRVPRTKSPTQLVAELEELRLRGWQDMVFVVDDNFIGNKQQRKLQEQAKQLALEARSKDEFLAMLAHELRNPLAPLCNGIDVLRIVPPSGEQAKQILDMMEEQAHNLVRLIDDLLDVSRITRGKLELRRQRVALSKIITNAIQTAQPLIQCKRP